jgi:hypothetical protein
MATKAMPGVVAVDTQGDMAHLGPPDASRRGRGGLRPMQEPRG